MPGVFLAPPNLPKGEGVRSASNIRSDQLSSVVARPDEHPFGRGRPSSVDCPRPHLSTTVVRHILNNSQPPTLNYCGLSSDYPVPSGTGGRGPFFNSLSFLTLLSKNMFAI